MTLPTYALKYWACTAEEMRTFIKNRTGTDAEPRRRREVYLQILRQLDEEARFPRFLELPPELREFVYLELLEYDWARRHAHTEILRASKLLYKESLPILHDNSTVRLGAVFTRGGDPDETVARPGVGILCFGTAEWLTKYRSGMTTIQARDFLQPFANLRHLEMALGFIGSGRPPTQQWVLPCRYLEALVQTCKRLRLLRLHVHNSVAVISTKSLVEMLAPLTHLSSKCKLVLDMENTAAKLGFFLMWAHIKNKAAKTLLQEARIEDEEVRQDSRGHVDDGERVDGMDQGV